MTSELLRVLQTLRLKGRVLPADLAAATGIAESRCTAMTNDLITSNHAEEVRGRLKLTVDGRDRLAELLAAERETVDHEAIEELYAEFEPFNAEVKSLMTRWQLKDHETPNEHDDPDYDKGVLDGLNELDARFRGLLERMVTAVPRLAHYPARFAGALSRINAGDHSWFAKPLADSYHTVWFELHEDLIGLAGLSRAEEAAAGRAE